MGKIIGIISEKKIPVDRRTPLTPEQALEVQNTANDVKVICEPSAIRCFEDAAYQQAGIATSEDIDTCDILLGVKEVPTENLISNKTYLFFSHTIKKQQYNRGLLQEVLKKQIRLIDYEKLTNAKGQRVIAFGRYAGIVGAYNAIYTYGIKYNAFTLRRARDCFDLEDLKTEFKKVKLPPMKIVVTGTGRVGQGVKEVLEGLNIKEVGAEAYLHQSFDYPVYVQLDSDEYNKREDGQDFAKEDFYDNPEGYISSFAPYLASDILISAAYWDPKAPVLFSKEDMLKEDFKISIIADITCDIEGSIPSTKMPATIDDPVYDYDPEKDAVAKPYTGHKVTVMAVDNLPCELPRDASKDFGRELIDHVLPPLLGNDADGMIARATITDNGKLTPPYAYLQDFADGKG